MDSTTSYIEQYYSENPQYHDIPFEEFKLICNSPFKFIKEVLNRGILRDIRLQYFGVFEVVESRVKYFRNKLEENYKKKTISEKRYNERLKVFNGYESKG